MTKKKKRKIDWSDSVRHYNGRKYTRRRTVGYYPRKQQAIDEAKRWRDSGTPARIGKVGDRRPHAKGGGWGVWINRTKKFKKSKRK